MPESVPKIFLPLTDGETIDLFAVIWIARRYLNSSLAWDNTTPEERKERLRLHDAAKALLDKLALLHKDANENTVR